METGLTGCVKNDLCSHIGILITANDSHTTITITINIKQIQKSQAVLQFCDFYGGNLGFLRTIGKTFKRLLSCLVKASVNQCTAVISANY